MFTCNICGKQYKFASGLNNHKEKCSAGVPPGVPPPYDGGATGGPGVPPPYDGGATGGPIGGATCGPGVPPPYDGCATGGPGVPPPYDGGATGGPIGGATCGPIGGPTVTRVSAGSASGGSGAPPGCATTKASAQIRTLGQETAAIIHAQTKAIVAAAAAASAAAIPKRTGHGNGTVTTTTKDAKGNTVVTHNTTNVGNEEHNASVNINYIKRSEETLHVVRAVTAAANEYCKGRIVVTSEVPAPGGGLLHGISTSVNPDGTTVFQHPTRTVSIIETPPEPVSPEEEHEITLEKMTYLILSLIQNNNKLTKENHVLRTVVSKIDPAYFEE